MKRALRSMFIVCVVVVWGCGKSEPQHGTSAPEFAPLSHTGIYQYNFPEKGKRELVSEFHSNVLRLPSGVYRYTYEAHNRGEEPVGILWEPLSGIGPTPLFAPGTKSSFTKETNRPPVVVEAEAQVYINTHSGPVVFYRFGMYIPKPDPPSRDIGMGISRGRRQYNPRGV